MPFCDFARDVDRLVAWSISTNRKFVVSKRTSFLSLLNLTLFLFFFFKMLREDSDFFNSKFRRKLQFCRCRLEIGLSFFFLSVYVVLFICKLVRFIEIFFFRHSTLDVRVYSLSVNVIGNWFKFLPISVCCIHGILSRSFISIIIGLIYY